MSDKYGIDVLLPVLLKVAKLGNVIDKTVEGKKQDQEWTVLAAYWMGLVPELLSLPGVDYKLLAEQYKDLDGSERAQIVEAFKAEFDLADDKVESAVEGLFKVLATVDGMVRDVLEVVQMWK